MFQSPCGDSLFSDRSAITSRSHCETTAMFQSPCGDSLFSDTFPMVHLDLAWSRWFQSPCGDSLFSDETIQPHEFLNERGSFNPLAGIRCFLTRRPARGGWRGAYSTTSFNPLAGIRCFLTVCNKTRAGKTWKVQMFQSPSGDSLFSDVPFALLFDDTPHTGFNPLAGIRCFLTHDRGVSQQFNRHGVSIP